MSESKTVLIVDDDQDQRDSISLLLTSKGYDVITAADSSDAMLKISNRKPDVVLLDVIMEEVDAGIVLSEQLNGLVPVILISSIADSATQVFDLHKLPVSDILQKPLNHHNLFNAIKKATC